jgi:hypothetical protein
MIAAPEVDDQLDFGEPLHRRSAVVNNRIDDSRRVPGRFEFASAPAKP